MNKAIKKEIERNLRQPSAEYAALITKYKKHIKGTEKEIIVKFFYGKKYKYRATMRELNQHGFYMEQTTFYRLKEDIINDVALWACYCGLICPYCNDLKP